MGIINDKYIISHITSVLLWGSGEGVAGVETQVSGGLIWTLQLCPGYPSPPL